jgi:hypothetical protein
MQYVIKVPGLLTSVVVGNLKIESCRRKQCIKMQNMRAVINPYPSFMQ